MQPNQDPVVMNESSFVTPSAPPPPPERSRMGGILRWATIFSSIAFIVGVGAYAATKILQANSGSASPTPSASVQPGVSTNERSNIGSDKLSDSQSQLAVTALNAENGDISSLLVKALQVSASLDLQGNASVSGNGAFGGNVTAANITAGIITGTAFNGNGAGLTNVNAALLGGQSRTYFENLAGGSAANAATLNNLATNAALKNANNTFTANNTFNGNVTVAGSTNLGPTTIASLTLGAPLTTDQGGTGLAAIPAQGILYGQGGPAMAVATPAGAGLCLVSGASDVQWGSCSGSAAGVNSLNGAVGTVTIAGASAAGTTITLGNASTGTKGIASFNATNFSVTSGAVDTIQSIAVGATPTFAGLNLTAALAVASGGTGTNTFTSNGVIVGNGTSALTAVAAGGAGLCLISNAGAPSWQACPGGGAVTSVNGQTGVVNIANSTGSAGTITVQDASTAQKGLAQFNSTNFTVSGGTANTIQNINTTATPTFAGLNTNTITPSAALTVGSTTQNATLQGANTTITSTNGANVAQLTFAAPTANVTYRLQTAAAGTYDVCTTAGNCVGTGGSVSTSGGSANVIPKYTSASGIGPSLLTDNGTLVTVGGNLSVTGTVAFTTALTVGNGGTGSTSAGGARTNLGAAASGANSDITSLSGLTTALSVVQGGSGATSLTANGVLLGNGTSPISSLVAGSAGQCLVSTAGAPTFTTCPGGGGVASLNTLTGALTLANASTAGSTITIDNATTTTKGIASFSGTNFTVTAGAVDTIQSIATGASPTFAAINTNALTPSGALTVGSTTQNATLQGANTTITSTNGANVAQLTFVAPTTNVTYRLQTAAAGTYDVCTTAGNCVGTGGSVSTSGGSANVIPKYTSASAIGPSLLTDNGTLVTVGGNLSVTGTATITGALTLTTALTVGNGGTGSTSAGGARTNLGAAASGANSDITSLSGLTTALSVVQGGSGATSLTANGVLLGNGTSPISSLVAGSAGECLISGVGAPSWQTCPGGSGGVTSLNSLAGALTLANSSGVGSTITIDNATTGAKGIASFNSTNFTATSGAVNTVQNINTGASPTFAGVNTNTITPSAALTVGAASQAFTIQGNSSSVFTATSGANTTTVGFATPTANTTVNFPASAAGSYTVCTTAGNCAGTGGGVTTTGGTTGALARFSGAQTLVDSIISDSGTVVTVAGGAVVQGSAGLTLGVSSSVNGKLVFNNATNGNTTTLQSGAAGSNLAFTLPVADGASGDCLTTNASGVLSFTPCLSGTGGGGSGVASLNGLSGTLSVANASGSGATITINDASTSQKGIAQFNTTNFQAASGTINTIQDIATSSSPSFAALAVTSATGLTIGTGTALGQLALRDGSSAFNVKFQPATQTANHTITVPNASGTLAVSASGNVALDAAGNITFTGQLPVANGGTGANNATTARSNLGAAASGANSDITSLTGLTTALSVPQGGTGAAALTANGVILGNGTSPLSSLVAGAAGLCLTSNAGAPSWQTCAGAGGVSSLNGQTGAVTLANSSGSGGTVTIDDATTGAKGIASFSSTNFTITSGAVNTIQSIATSATPTFVGVNTNAITPSAALTVGSTGQNLTLQGATTTITSTNGANAAQFTFVAPTANVTYRLQTAAAGTYDVCTTANNCVGTGGSVSTSGGSAGVIPKYTSASAIGPSLLSDNGTTVTVGGNLNVTGSVTLTTQLSVANGGTGAVSLTANGLVVGNGTGALTTVSPGSTGQCLLGNTGSAPSFGTCPATNLQNAYTASTGGTTPEIKLDSTRGGLDIQDANTTIGGSLLTVRAANGSGLGASLFDVNSTGQTLFKNSTNSTTAFQIQNAGATPVLTIDTSNTLIRVAGPGTGASLTSGTGSIQVGPDNSFNLAIDDNEIMARNNGGTETLFVQRLGGGLTSRADLTVFQPITNSITAWQVLNAAGTTPVLNADTTNARLGIGTIAPNSALDVTGPLMNTGNNFNANITAWDTAAAAQNVGGGIGFGGNADQQRLFSAIQGYHESATSADYAGALKFLTRPSGSSTLQEQARIGSTGQTVFKNSTDSTSAFQIQTSGGVGYVTADSSNKQLVLGTSSSTTGAVKLLNATNTNAVTLQSGVSGSNYTITLPTTAPGTSQCLGTDAATASQLVFSACGGSGVTTVGTFSGSSQTNGATIVGTTITFGPADASNPGMVTTGTQTLAGAKTLTGNTTFTGTILQKSDSASAFILQDSTGAFNNLAFDSSTGHLKIYDHTAPRTAYADIYYSAGNAVFTASTGTTQIGSGTGDVTVALTNNGEKFNFTHTGTTAAGTDDFIVQRNITGGSAALSGNILRVEDLSTTSGTKTSNLLYINQNNTSSTGNLILAQTGGSTTRFQVANTGAVSIASGQGITGLGALSLDSASATALNIGPNNASSIVIGNAANNSAITISGGSGTITIGSAATARTINIGTPAAAQTVTIGSTNTTSSLSLQSGTGTISLGTGGQARAINLGTGAAAQTVTLGSTTGASSLLLNSGSGGLNIGTSAVSQAITIGNSTGGALRVGQNGSTVQIDGTNFDVSTTGLTTLLGGLTTDLSTSVSATVGQTFTLQPGTSTGASANGAATNIKGGDASGTTSVTAGSLALQGGSATGASGTRNGGNVTIDAGTGATLNGSVSIGAANATSVTLGNIVSNITTTIHGNALVRTTATNSTTAFVVQDTGSNALFTADTTNNRVYVGPVAGATAGSLLILGNQTAYTGGAQAGEPTGVAGGMYYNSALGQFRCYEVDHWRDCMQSARTAYNYINEMLTDNPDEAINYNGTGAGGGVTNGATAAATGHPGINTLSTGTTSSGAAQAWQDDSAGNAILLGNGDYWRYESVVKTPTLSTGTERYDARAGFTDAGGFGGDGVDGCFFKYSDATNSGKWQGYCGSNVGGGGSSSVCDSTITVAAATWYRLTVVVNAAGNSVDFRVNGVSRCQVTTNIPTGAGRYVSHGTSLTKTIGTTPSTLDIDYISLEGQFGTAR